MVRTVNQQYLWAFIFLRLNFPGRAATLWIPFIVSLAAAILFFKVPDANLSGDRGLLDVSSGLLAVLEGFFVASLGVIAALPKGKIDKAADMSRNPPTLEGKPLSWRQFGLHVSSYLIIMGLITYSVSMLALIMLPSAPEDLLPPLRAVVGGLYTALFVHLMLITVFALFLIAKKFPDEEQRLTGIPKKGRRLENT